MRLWHWLVWCYFWCAFRLQLLWHWSFWHFPYTSEFPDNGTKTMHTTNVTPQFQRMVGLATAYLNSKWPRTAAKPVTSPMTKPRIVEMWCKPALCSCDYNRLTNPVCICWLVLITAVLLPTASIVKTLSSNLLTCFSVICLRGKAVVVITSYCGFHEIVLFQKNVLVIYYYGVWNLGCRMVFGISVV